MLFHRRGAKLAENFCFMSAVDPASLRDRYPGKHKGQFASKTREAHSKRIQ